MAGCVPGWRASGRTGGCHASQDSSHRVGSSGSRSCACYFLKQESPMYGGNCD